MGTLEEFSEISTWAQLDRHKKPIVLCNIEGYWQPLLLLLDHMRQEQFIRTGLELKVDVATTARAAVERFVERIQTEEPQPVPFKPVRQQM
jgi:predicted Rossmann-fold nucleotide-binding protein